MKLHYFLKKCNFYNHSLKGLHLISKNPNSYVEHINVKECEFVNIGDWGNTGANSISYGGYSRNTITENCVFLGDKIREGVDGILIVNNIGNGSNHLIRNCNFNGLEENSIDLKHVVESPLKEGKTRIYGNAFSNSNQLEIVLHMGTQGVEIYRNRFVDGRHAIGLIRHNNTRNDNGNIIVAYNIFGHFSSGLLTDTHPEGIGNNIFVNNTCGFIGKMNRNNYSIQIATNNWIIKNNIFFLLSEQKNPYCPIKFTQNVDMQSIDINNNYYSLTKGEIVHRIGRQYFKINQLGQNELLDGGSQKLKTIDELNIRKLSNCVDKGEFVAGIHPTIDFDGNPSPSNNGSLPDIGAQELPLPYPFIFKIIKQ